MSNSDNVYAFGRVRVLETFLITSDKLKALLEADNAGAMLKSLLDMGYGAGLSVKHPQEFEALIRSDLDVAYKLVKQLISDSSVADIFFLHVDYQNLKVLLKSKLLNKEPGEALSSYGTIPVKELQEAVFQNKYEKTLPIEMQALLKKFDEGSCDDSDAASLADQALYDQIARCLKTVKEKSIIQYFNVQADYYNVISLFRAKALNNLGSLERSYLNLGNVLLQDLKQAFEMSDKDAVEFISKQPLDKGIFHGLSRYLSDASLSALEKNRDNFFIKLFKPLSADPFGVIPAIGYLLAKEQQAKIIRLIMTAKISSLPKKLAEERLRDLYE